MTRRTNRQTDGQLIQQNVIAFLPYTYVTAGGNVRLMAVIEWARLWVLEWWLVYMTEAWLVSAARRQSRQRLTTLPRLCSQCVVRSTLPHSPGTCHQHRPRPRRTGHTTCFICLLTYSSFNKQANGVLVRIIYLFIYLFIKLLFWHIKTATIKMMNIVNDNTFASASAAVLCDPSVNLRTTLDGTDTPSRPINAIECVDVYSCT